MKKCINCGRVSSEKEVKVYGSKTVLLLDKSEIREGCVIDRQPYCERCPECGGTVERMELMSVTEEQVLYVIARQNINIYDTVGGIISIPAIAHCLKTSKYQVRNHVKSLKSKGLIVLDYAPVFSEDEIIPPYKGWTLSEKGKQTEQYFQAEKEQSEEIKRIFGN